MLQLRNKTARLLPDCRYDATLQNILIRLYQRLDRISKRILDIETQFDSLRTVGAKNVMTLREFTEKQLSDRRTDDEKADSTHRRTAAMEEAGLLGPASLNHTACRQISISVAMLERTHVV
jgi:hypothetical protein